MSEEGMIALINAYFDESGTHDQAKILVVAGYLFADKQAWRFNRDWGKFLSEDSIPYAHMTDLANGGGYYADLSMERRVLHGIKLIENIKRRSKFGFAVGIDKQYYDEHIDIEGLPTAYTFAAMACLQIIRSWADDKKYVGPISYFFEAGADSQNEFAGIMNTVSSGLNAKDIYRHVSHSFVDKKQALPLQAADMLAWQVHHFHERCAKGFTQPRKDYVALMREKVDVCQLYDRHELDQYKIGALSGGII